MSDKTTLLLIDGSQILMDITRKILERSGYNVRCALGIAGAREQLADITPDSIILGTELPDGDGLAFCHQLREDVDAPILVFSNDKDDELPALQAGANDFLKKPFSFDILKARINIMLGAGPTIPSFGDVVFETYSGNNHAPLSHVHVTSSQKEAGHKIIPPKMKPLFLAAVTLLSLVLVCAIALYAASASGLFDNSPGSIFSKIWQTPHPSPPVSPAATELDPTERPPLKEGPDATGKDPGMPFHEGTQIIPPGTDGIAVAVGATAAKTLLLNPESNPCYFGFEITLVGTGEVIYSSGLLAPGQSIEEIELTRTFEEGTYDAVIDIHAYSLDDFTFVFNDLVWIRITAD